MTMIELVQSSTKSVEHTDCVSLSGNDQCSDSVKTLE